jgi:DNA mismatch repair ATPase MutS
MFSSKKKKLQHIRDIWPKQIDKYRNFDLIALYHRLLDHSNDKSSIDEKTWDDLDFTKLYVKMDRNITGFGQQYLYHLLHTYEPDEVILKRRFDVITHLRRNQELRERIQLDLLSSSDTFSHFVAHLVLDKKLPNTKYYRLFYLCPILFIGSIFAILIHNIFILVTMVVALFNLILNKVYSKTIYRYFSGFSALNALISTALSLSTIHTAMPISEIENLKQQRSLLKSLRKRLGYLVIDKESLNELIRVAIEYLNLFLLFDIIAYYRSVNTLLSCQEDIHEVFKNVASLDVCGAIASYLEDVQNYTTPEFHSVNDLSFQNLYHPLIQNAVPNSLDNFPGSMLITGSNMSGKTTFMKTVGLNVILAQTLYFSHAKSFTIPRLIVKSSIKRNEDLEAGKSYFFAEIEEIHKFLELAEHGNNFLFLIDEIFRGTNTVERLASSAAVLKYLCSRNKVFVTTHDIELQDLLDGHFQMFHFSEQVEEERFFFNYKINKGPCSSGNAIKLLEIMGYPASIVRTANATVKELLSNAPLIKKSSE